MSEVYASCFLTSLLCCKCGSTLLPKYEGHVVPSTVECINQCCELFHVKFEAPQIPLRSTR